LYDAGFDAFWELDFFGRVRRGVEARRAELQGAEANLHDAQVSVIAEVARTYFELAASRLSLPSRDATSTTRPNPYNSHRRGSMQPRNGAGYLARASQLSATLSTIAPLEAAVARSIHRPGADRPRSQCAW